MSLNPEPPVHDIDELVASISEPMEEAAAALRAVARAPSLTTCNRLAGQLARAASCVNRLRRAIGQTSNAATTAAAGDAG